MAASDRAARVPRPFPPGGARGSPTTMARGRLLAGLLLIGVALTSAAAAEPRQRRPRPDVATKEGGDGGGSTKAARYARVAATIDPWKIVTQPVFFYLKKRCTGLGLPASVCSGEFYNPQVALALGTVGLALLVTWLLKVCDSQGRRRDRASSPPTPPRLTIADVTTLLLVAALLLPKGGGGGAGGNKSGGHVYVAEKRAFVVDRSYVAEASGKGRESVRLVSYNILGDGPNLALSEKHGYCPRELRLWGDEGAAGGKGRCSRLVEEVAGYRPDLLCVQELSIRMMADLAPRLASKAIGLQQVVHVGNASTTNPAHEHTKNFPRGPIHKDFIGTAVFVNPDKVELVASKGLLMHEVLDRLEKTGAKPFSGNLRKRLKSLTDGMVLALVKPKGGDKLVLVVCCHLFWNPNWPHAKVAQSYLATVEARHFLEQRGLDPDAVGVVIAGDFNSMRHVQPSFFPAEQKALYAQKGGGLAAGYTMSGVYELYSKGRLVAEHPEHPDSFGRSIESVEAEAVSLGVNARRSATPPHPTDQANLTPLPPAHLPPSGCSQARRQGGEETRQGG